MDISKAKKEIKNAILAYTAKSDTGIYRIPLVRQRPVLLMGPPGIGKTAIIEQIARELGIGLVAYTMTHHTRQSAIGLPMIEKRTYGGTEYSVTEYTMSEIIASVYEQKEHAGTQEGILFLDEINCVSETLMPAMLQFLQYKTFGNHKLPDGWIIVAAGNPAKYNIYVREFDTVTLDRLKLIEIEPDFEVWKAYALERGIHPIILSYLTLKPESFFSVLSGENGRSFITARAWEDLSEMLLAFEALNIPAEEGLFSQYLQHKEIAGEFAIYYELAISLTEKYRPDEILINGGEIPELKLARFDERLCVIQFLLHRLHALSEEWSDSLHLFTSFEYFTNGVESGLAETERPFSDIVNELMAQREKSLNTKKSFGLISPKDEEHELKLLSLIKACHLKIQLAPPPDYSASLQAFRAHAMPDSKAIESKRAFLENAFINCFDFMEKTFGKSQELIIFLTELSMHEPSNRFIGTYLHDLNEAALKSLDLKSQEASLREKLNKQASIPN